MAPSHGLQPEEANDWGEVDPRAAEVLFRLAPFLKLGLYKQVLKMGLPELKGYTWVSSA